MKLHRLSLPFRALPRGISLGAAGFFLGTILAPQPAIGAIGLVPLGAILGFVLGAGYEVAYYRRFDYELTEDTFDIASGVFSRRNREIPLGRIQNVDISRNILQRVFDIASLDIETAGGGETEASLRYVSYDEAKGLQSDIRRRKRGEGDRRTAGEASGPTATDEADEPPTAEVDEPPTAGLGEPTIEEHGEELFALDIRSLVVLGLVAPDLRALLPVAFFAVPAVGLSIPDLLLDTGFLDTGPRGAALAVVSWLGTAAVTAARYYGFRLTRVGDELRYERGLINRYDGSIPLDKIQTVTLRENALMRRIGYAGLAVETAGYATGQGPSGGSEAAIPLASRERTLELARSIEGFEFAEPEFDRPPRRARRRYAVRYALAVGAVAGALYVANAVLGAVFTGDTLTGWGELLEYWYAPLVALLVVPVAAHLKWRNRGYALYEHHVLTRNGFWRRRTAVVPYYRVQTVIESRSPFQRWRHLSTVAIDTAGSLSIGEGGAQAVDFDVDEAVALRESVRERFGASLLERRTAGDRHESRGDSTLGRGSGDVA